MAGLLDLASFGGTSGGSSPLGDIAADVADVAIGVAATRATKQAAQDEDRLLQQQEQMAETQFYQQGLQRARRVRQVMAEATVQEAARGVSVASPSFKSVQRSSFEKFREDQDIAALNLSFQKEQIEQQRKIVRDKEKAAHVSTWGKIVHDIL
jgi:hypothetical protein